MIEGLFLKIMVYFLFGFLRRVFLCSFFYMNEIDNEQLNVNRSEVRLENFLLGVVGDTMPEMPTEVRWEEDQGQVEIQELKESIQTYGMFVFVFLISYSFIILILVDVRCRPFFPPCALMHFFSSSFCACMFDGFDFLF